VLVKSLGGTYSPIQIIFFSVLFSFPVVTLILIRQERGDSSLRPNRPVMTLARTAAVVVTALSAFTAFSTLPLAQAYALLFATPLLITLLSIPVLGERVGLRRGGAVVVGLIGVLVVLRPGSTALSIGHAAGLTAALGAATAALLMRKIGGAERTVVLLLYPLLANIAVMGAMLPMVYEPMPLADLSALAALSLLSLVATAGMIVAYRLGEAVIVAPMQYSQIVWAALYGTLIFAEPLDAPTLAGAAIVIASGTYIVLRESGATISLTRPVLGSRARLEGGIVPQLLRTSRPPD